MGKHIKFISYLQIIGIILVVIGHSFHECPVENAFGAAVLRIVYAFHMPVFMFASGYLMIFTTKARKRSLKEFTYSKVKRLLIPFFVLTLVTFVPRVMLSSVADDAMKMDMSTFITSFLYYGKLVIPYLWFLQSSFMLLVGIFFILLITEKLKIKDIYIYILLVAIFGYLTFNDDKTTFLSLNMTCKVGFYFVMGCCYCRWQNKVDKVIAWDKLYTMLLFMISFIYILFWTENSLFAPVETTLGVLMTISLSKIMVKHNISFLDHLDGSNYMIFLLSWYINTATQQVLHHFVEMPWWIYSTLSIVFGIYIPWWYYRYTLRHPYNTLVRITNVLLGHKNKEQGC